MYLLHTTELRLYRVVDHRDHAYGILSHTWGEEEVTFDDIQRQHRHSLKGFLKVQKACELAASDGCHFIWIDSCCIDKSSSAELSEAINSMYTWYQSARCCYTYLSDFDRGSGTIDGVSLRRSRWFRRGWTLQELLAPRTVAFYDRHWSYIGDKTSLIYQITLATGIGEAYLEDNSCVPTASVATRMSWAAHRQTTRLEDEAYCLIGLFDVNMPLLYGEGRKAFRRLQYEIARNIEDESLFAWQEPVLESGMFAPSPKSFAWSGDIGPLSRPRYDRTPFTITNRGLQFEAVCNNIPPELSKTFHTYVDDSSEYLLCPLNCASEEFGEPFVVILKKMDQSNVVVRFLPGQYLPASSCFPSLDKLQRRTVYITEPSQESQWHELFLNSCPSEILIPEDIQIWYVTPPSFVEPRADGGRILHFPSASHFAVITVGDTKRTSSVLILEHEPAQDDEYRVLLQSMNSEASIMECISSWRRSYGSSNNPSQQLTTPPVLFLEHLGDRRAHKNGDCWSKPPTGCGIGIYQGNYDLWRLELSYSP
ncbi:MAG: hypothetical protein Q9202_007585 [Teloschistes flavicans]